MITIVEALVDHNTELEKLVIHAEGYQAAHKVWAEVWGANSILKNTIKINKL